MVSISFKVLESWHRKVKQAAANDNRSLVRYIVQAVNEKMERDARGSK